MFFAINDAVMTMRCYMLQNLGSRFRVCSFLSQARQSALVTLFIVPSDTINKDATLKISDFHSS